MSKLYEKFNDVLLRLFANVINIETAKKEILALGEEWLLQFIKPIPHSNNPCVQYLSREEHNKIIRDLIENLKKDEHCSCGAKLDRKGNCPYDQQLVDGVSD